MQSLDEGYNQSNLFYGGARAKGLGEFAQDYQGQLAGAAGQQQPALGQIDQNLAAALYGADQSDIDAETEAANRALQIALAAAGDPGAPTPPPPALPSPYSSDTYVVGGVMYRNGKPVR